MARKLGKYRLKTGRWAILAGLATLCWAAVPAAAACESPAVEVNVNGVRNNTGLVAALIYDDNPDTFLKNGQKLHRVRQPARKGHTQVCLPSPAPGVYAIAVFHDENANKKLDQGFLGIPEEGYGFSNNPGFRFGLPDMEEILFEIKGDRTEISVDLRYLIDTTTPGE